MTQESRIDRDRQLEANNHVALLQSEAEKFDISISELVRRIDDAYREERKSRLSECEVIRQIIDAYREGAKTA